MSPDLDKKPNVLTDVKNYIIFLGDLSVGDSYDIRDITANSDKSVQNYLLFQVVALDIGLISKQLNTYRLLSHAIDLSTAN